MATYKLKGINDEADYCSCCGRTELKRVVWLAKLDVDGCENADPLPYGTTCAGMLMSVKAGSKHKLNQKFDQLLYDAVVEKIRSIQSAFIPVDRKWLFPAECLGMSVSEMFAYKQSKWPILKFNEGKMTLAEAAKYL